MLVVFSDMIDPRITRDVENARFVAVVKNADVRAYVLCEVFSVHMYGLAGRDGEGASRTDFHRVLSVYMRGKVWQQQGHLKVLRPTLIGGGRG